MEDLLTTRECATFLGVTERRVRALIKPDGDAAPLLPAIRKGRDYLVEKADLVEFAGKKRSAGRPAKKIEKLEKR